jgi:protoporphyrin/coproporphyrin ferrochelatase
MSQPYDALLLLSFGGPERSEDVLPFLENVLRGKRVPRERMLEVAEHYYLFDGVSPINEQNRALLAALIPELTRHGIDLPVYWGNRNWHPMLADTMRQMAEDGVRRVLAFVTSAFASYSGCRQYLEDIEQARAEVGPQAPAIDKLRLFHNHPGFIEPMVERVAEAFGAIKEPARAAAKLVFSAHSLPLAMSDACAYVPQLRDTCQLVAERAGRPEWDLVYQSRSGPPSQPWLEPDVCDHLRRLHGAGCTDVVIVPIGFLSEHMEVIYDLDVEAAQISEEIGLNLVRSSVVGCHSRFVAMIRELIQERLEEKPERLSLGELGVSPDRCDADCCRWQSSRPT